MLRKCPTSDELQWAYRLVSGGHPICWTSHSWDSLPSFLSNLKKLPGSIKPFHETDTQSKQLHVEPFYQVVHSEILPPFRAPCSSFSLPILVHGSYAVQLHRAPALRSILHPFLLLDMYRKEVTPDAAEEPPEQAIPMIPQDMHITIQN